MATRNGRSIRPSRGLGRRDLFKSASGVAATAALVSAVRASFPGGAFAQTTGPETSKVTLGLHRAHRCLAADHRQGKEASSTSTA